MANTIGGADFMCLYSPIINSRIVPLVAVTGALPFLAIHISQ